jgi:hypothetical protein
MFLLDFFQNHCDCDVWWVNWTVNVTQQPEGVIRSYTYGRVADTEKNWFLMVLDWPGSSIYDKNTNITKSDQKGLIIHRNI